MAQSSPLFLTQATIFFAIIIQILLSFSSLEFCVFASTLEHFSAPNDDWNTERTSYVSPAGSNNTSCGNTPENACSIAAAATQADDTPHRFIFAPGHYTITEPIHFVGRGHISIINPNHERTVFLEAATASAKLYFDTSGVSVSNITFRWFNAGAVDVSAGRTGSVFEGCSWSLNSRKGSGGAAVVFRGDEVTFRQCEFDSNVVNGVGDASTLAGGAVLVRFDLARKASIIIENCKFTRNSVRTSVLSGALLGGAVRIETNEGSQFFSDHPVSIVVNGSLFASNEIVVDAPHWPQSFTGPQLEGGALSTTFNVSVSVQIIHSEFLRCSIESNGVRPQSSCGGAVSIASTHPNSSFVFFESKAVGNAASAGTERLETSNAGLCQGGAVRLYTSGEVKIIRSQMNNNKCFAPHGGVFGSMVRGGAFHLSAVAQEREDAPSLSLSIEESLFKGNSLSSEKSTLGNAEMDSGAAVSLQLRHVYFIKSLSIADTNFISNKIEVVSGDGSGGSISIDNYGSSPTPLQIPMTISRCLFSDNSVYGKRQPSIVESAKSPPRLSGAAIWIAMRLSNTSQIDITNCTFSNNFLTPYLVFADRRAATAEGAAIQLHLESLASRVLRIENSQFISNNATGYMATGAVTIRGNSEVAISNCSFISNTVNCAGPSGLLYQCQGGAVAAFDGSMLSISHCRFAENSIQSTEHCATARGGAIYASATVLSVSNSIFEQNFISNAQGFGGAVSTDLGSSQFLSCEWIGNRIDGQVAFGGSVSSTSGNISFIDASFLASATNSPKLAQIQCKNDFFNHPDLSQAGGTLAISLGPDSARLVMVRVDISYSVAYHGGAILITGTMPSTIVASQILNVTVSHSVASAAGGGLFLNSLCEFDNAHTNIASFCERFKFDNVQSLLYGPECATHARKFEFVDSGNSSLFFASGAKRAMSFYLYDAFGSKVRDPSASVLALALNQTTSSVKMRSGAPQDAVLPDHTGLYRFDDFSLVGNTSDRLEVMFTTNAVPVCSLRSLQPIALKLQMSACLPSHVQIGGICVPCPARTYSLSANPTECEPCSEERPEGSVEEEYSCLVPSDLKQSSHNVFEIAEGFYPSPSFVEPHVLLECPNEACHPFECDAVIREDLTWFLNCSRCPKHHDEHDDHHGNQTDCHCAVGYENRLCSRCSCDASSGKCYFFSGEREDHECLPCKSQSTAIVVVAVLLLQISLVVFLLFQRSGLALLLAEAAIAITLIILGIGETWLLDLLLIMGLLFLATSFSKRLEPKPLLSSSDVSESEDLHDDDHNKHGHHELESQTAALAKISVFFLQSVASVVRNEIWPSWIDSTMKQLEALNLRVSGAECFFPSFLSEPLGKLLFQMSLPWILGLNLVLAALIAAAVLKVHPVYRCKSLMRRFQSKRRGPSARSQVEDSDGETSNLLIKEEKEDPSPSDDEEPRPTQHQLVGDLRSRALFAFLFMISASYFELSNSVLEILRPCEHGYMVAFPWVACSFNDSRFPALFVSAVVFFILYSVGIPGFFGLILLRNRKRILAGDPALMSKFGFLYETYRPKIFWFELVWFLRRILLSFAVSVVSPRPGFQMLLLMIILLGSMVLHRYASPFSSAVANLLDLVATAVLILAVVLGFVAEQYEIGRSTAGHIIQNTIWALCALCASCMLFVLVLPFFRALVRLCRQKLRTE